MHYSHMAEHVRSRGRGDDTMLIHMTPDEVSGLQNLAMAHGGSLTINPDTGLPEAGWLGKLLPTLLGGLGMAFGIPPIWMGALGAIGGTAITGDLKQGLMAGLGAFGGASLAGAAGIGSALGHVGAGIGLPGSSAAVMHPAALAGTAAKAATPVINALPNSPLLATAGATAPASAAASPFLTAAVPQALAAPAQTGLGAVMSNFGQAARAGLPGGIIGKAAPMLAGAGVLGSVSNAMTPTPAKTSDKKEPDEYGYTGPYQMHRQVLNPNAMAPGQMQQFDPTNFDSSEKLYFGPTTYTDASGKEWIPGQKTTPTAANATSAMANPVMLTPEQRMKLFGYAVGGPVGNTMQLGNTLTTATQNAPQTTNQAIPQPVQQSVDNSFQPQAQAQPSPYTQPSAYGQPQGGIQQQSGGQQQQGSDGVRVVVDRPAGIQGLPGLAAGGTLHMRSGSFVMPARETAEFGNGSSNAGQQVLARLGGTPIHGPGDGVSDSVPARINGKQSARVARDEVHFSPEAVARLGGGDHNKGTQKLYALMKKAQHARKTAKRGQDTGLRAMA